MKQITMGYEETSDGGVWFRPGDVATNRAAAPLPQSHVSQ